LGGHVPSAWLVPLAILALFAFAALMTFRRARTWSTILLLSFALMAGVLLRLMLLELHAHWLWVLAASVGIPMLGIPFGWTAGERLRSIAWATWAAAWLYILGWIAWQLLAKGSVMRLPWGIAGLLVFTALTITWSASLPGRPP
jgi:hypothetical protein